MKTYRVTVVRMVEGTAIVSASSATNAKILVERGYWDEMFNEQRVGVEVVGEPDEINEGDE